MRSLLFYLLLFSLPFQTRTLLFAGANEYQSAFLYASDILAALLFVIWIFSQSLHSHIAQTKEHYPLILPGLVLIVWLLISSLFSDNPALGFYRTSKIAEFFWIFYYLLLLPKAEFLRAMLVLLGAGVLQSLLAVAQFVSQQSLGLTLLGENILSPDIPGVAKLDMGEKMIRAYGTFPHPNALAAFLVVCTIILIHLLATSSPRVIALPKWTWIVLPIFAVGLLLTFSRVAIITLLGVLVLWFFFSYREKSLRVGILLIASLFFAGLLFAPYVKNRLTTNIKGQEVAYRIFYTKTAFDIIRSHPLTGVGLGQFTAFQETRIKAKQLPPYANQPAHNIYLLFIAEAGLVGLFIFYWFLHNLFYPLYASLSLRRALPYLMLPFAIFIIGSFDHFFISFQQGQFLFWLSLGAYANAFKFRI